MLQTGLSWGERVVYWLVILGLLSLLIFYRRATLPVAIFVNGKPVAWVSNLRLANRAVELAKSKFQEQYGHDVDFAEPIDIGNLPLPSGQKLMSPSEASELLLKSVSPAERHGSLWLTIKLLLHSKAKARRNRL
jgi:hypothetical protein